MIPWLNPRGRTLIGVVHLRPLPGSPRWGGSMAEVVDRAVEDAAAYEAGGADALCLENFGDLPFTKGPVAPETIAAMAAAGEAVRRVARIPHGFNVLRNDVRGALALCAACAGAFVRVNVHTGAMLTDQGVVEGAACETLRQRRVLCPVVSILADVHVKHAVPLAGWPIGDAARDTAERGLADGLIISGVGTGLATDRQDVAAVREACPRVPLFLGSGVTVSNVADYLGLADAFIVGSSLKREGLVANPVDRDRVAALAERLRAYAPG